MSADAGSAVTRFDFASGPLRGSYLALYPTCLVHRSEWQFETLPLAAVGSVRVAFERNLRHIGWGAGLIVIALVLLAIASPLGGVAAGAAEEVAAAGNQGVARGLLAFFHFLGAVASLLPALALACALGAAALIALGWIGATILTLSLAGSERVFPARGRNTQLLEFSELLSERLMSLGR
jgi:hypothetical protein